MEDDEAQCNELLALNSIFTEECFQEHAPDKSTENKVRNGALLLTVEHTNPLIVCSNQKSDEQKLVQYLPPIMLRFSLPEDYPSRNAPKFTLLCPWLKKDQITTLSAELDRLWSENVGSVVLFIWASFLQNSTLDVLSLNSTPLQISPDILHHVLQYNVEQADRIFSKAWITCLVCMREKSGNASMLFKACNHAFCRECLGSYFEMLIKDGNVRRLNCPYDKCETEANPAQVRELVSKEAFERYDRLLLKKAVNAMKDITCCPRKACGHPIVRDLGGVGTCQLCQFVFCLSCRNEYHHMQPCGPTEEEIAMRTFMNSKAANDISWMTNNTSYTFDYSAPGAYLQEVVVEKPTVATKYGQGEWERLINDGYSQTFMLKHECRPCPSCDTPIQKNGGCDHMHCVNCDHDFCWVCLSVYTNIFGRHEHNQKNMDKIQSGFYGNWASYD